MRGRIHESTDGSHSGHVKKSRVLYSRRSTWISRGLSATAWEFRLCLVHGIAEVKGGLRT